MGRVAHIHTHNGTVSLNSFSRNSFVSTLQLTFTTFVSTNISTAFIFCSLNDNSTVFSTYRTFRLCPCFSSTDISTSLNAYTSTDTSNPFRSQVFTFKLVIRNFVQLLTVLRLLALALIPFRTQLHCDWHCSSCQCLNFSLPHHSMLTHKMAV